MAYGFNDDKSKVDVYSETEIDQMRTRDIADWHSAVASEASIRAAADNTLDARIDNILIGYDDDPNKDSELVDIRTTNDGRVFSSAGDAVRDTQASINNSRFEDKKIHSTKFRDNALHAELIKANEFEYLPIESMKIYRDNCYVNNDGNLNTAVSHQVCIIDVTNVQVVRIRPCVNGVEPGANQFYVFDENMNIIRGFKPDANNYRYLYINKNRTRYILFNNFNFGQQGSHVIEYCPGIDLLYWGVNCDDDIIDMTKPNKMLDLRLYGGSLGYYNYDGTFGQDISDTHLADTFLQNTNVKISIDACKCDYEIHCVNDSNFDTNYIFGPNYYEGNPLDTTTTWIVDSVNKTAIYNGNPFSDLIYVNCPINQDKRLVLVSKEKEYLKEDEEHLSTLECVMAKGFAIPNIGQEIFLQSAYPHSLVKISDIEDIIAVGVTSNSSVINAQFVIFCDADDIVLGFAGQNQPGSVIGFLPDNTSSIYINWFGGAFQNTSKDWFDGVRIYRKEDELFLNKYIQDIPEVVNHVIAKPISFNGKTTVFFGDSITEGYVNGHEIADNPWPQIISEWLSMTGKNFGVSGSSFVEHSGYGVIKNKMISKVADIQTADFIFIAGGINDWQLASDLDDFALAVADTIEYAKTNKKANAEIFVISPINHADGGYYGGNAIAPAEKYMQIVMEQAIAKNVNYINGKLFPFPTKVSSFSSVMYGDTLHPTQVGYYAYAKSILEAIA